MRIRILNTIQVQRGKDTVSATNDRDTITLRTVTDRLGNAGHSLRVRREFAVLTRLCVVFIAFGTVRHRIHVLSCNVIVQRNRLMRALSDVIGKKKMALLMVNVLNITL